MNKAKYRMNIFEIFLKGIQIYLKNFIPLTKVMLFPVLGQIFGIIWIIFTAFYLSQNIAKSFTPEVLTNNIIFIFFILIVAILPGFFVFTKAFWEYMIAMVSLNSMVSNIIKQGQLKDAHVHSRLVKVKSKEFIGLLLFLSLIWLFGLMLPAVVFFIQSPFVGIMFAGLELIALMILTIISIYLSISYQVFAFENLSVINIVKRSWNLVEGNFWRTFFLGFVVVLLTNMLIPSIFQTVADKISLTTFMVQPLQPYAVNLSGNPVYLNLISSGIMGQKLLPTAFSYLIIKFITQAILGGIVTAFLLPLGSACYTLLYLDIVDRKSFKSKKK